jgi:CRP/FNR family cyclic AMP-dependent transcriptional regulator
MPGRTTDSKGDVVPETLREAWELLEQAGWLARRSSEARKLLFQAARLRTFSAGDVVYAVGDKPNGIFGLVSGTLEADIPRVDGEECLFHRAETGFWVGDLALFSGQRRLMTLRATSLCTLVYLPQDELSSIVARHPDLNRDFYELSHDNMRTVLELLGNLSIPQADNRIALRLLMHADTLKDSAQWIELSQDTLARMVAVSPKTVRRCLLRLQALGLIETGYAKLRIRDREGLEKLCGFVGHD